MRVNFLVALFTMVVWSQFAHVSEVKAQSSDIVYKSRDNVVDHWVTSDGVTKFSGYVEMPQNLHPAPDDKTINYYYIWLCSEFRPRGKEVRLRDLLCQSFECMVDLDRSSVPRPSIGSSSRS